MKSDSVVIGLDKPSRNNPIPVISIRFTGFSNLNADIAKSQFEKISFLKEDNFENFKKVFSSLSAIKDFSSEIVTSTAHNLSMKFPEVPFDVLLEPFSDGNVSVEYNAMFVHDILTVNSVIQNLSDDEVSNFLIYYITSYLYQRLSESYSICASLSSFVPQELKDELFDRSVDLESRKIYHYLRNAIIDAITSADWMDEATKKNALLKSLRMSEFVQIPDIDYGYEALNTCSSKGFYLNFIQRNLAISEYIWAYPFQQNRRLQWPSYMLKYDSGNQMGYSVINAFYMPTSNIFVLPYGILGRPFFEINRPVSMNFGSIGMVSAHELSQ